MIHLLSRLQIHNIFLLKYNTCRIIAREIISEKYFCSYLLSYHIIVDETCIELKKLLQNELERYGLHVVEVA